ncbi:MAG: leucine-rich repeat domain-containing protein [Clostridiaceae bacterium]
MTHSDYTSASTERALMKTRIRGLIAVLLVLALSLTLFGCGLFKDRSLTTLTIDDAAQIDAEDLVKYEDLQELDIRKADITVDQYAALQSALPNCSIHWSVPIMDQRFDNQVTQLALPASTDAAALDLLRYFPNLTTVDALSCTCYDALMSKSLERKDITFTWQVQIGDVTLLNTDTTLDLSTKTLDAQALMQNIYYLPALTSVDITDTNIGAEDGAALEARYPNILFLRTIDLFGVKANTDVTALDLTKATVTDDTQLVDALASLKNLTSCDLTGQTVSFETMDALKERYPLVTFSFSFMLFGQQCTPDTTEINLQGQTFTSPDEVAAGLSHMPNLTLCDLCGTGLTNEQMVQLQTQFPTVKFVWYVQIGAWQLRTDIEAFTTQNRKDFPNNVATFTKDGNTKLTDEDVAGLAYCTDLVYLDLSGSKLTDISFVKSMPKLRLLCLGNNKITDISALSALTELEYLEIYTNAIADQSPLAGLTKLTHLNLARTGIPDITMLSGMKQLKLLYIMNNNKITKDDVAKLTEALPDCVIVSRGSNPIAGDWHKAELYHTFEVATGLAEPDVTPTPEPSASADPSASPTPMPSISPKG